MTFVFAIFLLFFPAETFTRFTYCHEMSRGIYELQCAELDPAGKGLVRFKRRAGDAIKIDVSLSASARDRFASLLEATNNLDQADTYESARKVADLGKKHFTLELATGNKR